MSCPPHQRRPTPPRSPAPSPHGVRPGIDGIPGHHARESTRVSRAGLNSTIVRILQENREGTRAATPACQGPAREPAPQASIATFCSSRFAIASTAGTSTAIQASAITSWIQMSPNEASLTPTSKIGDRNQYVGEILAIH